MGAEEAPVRRGPGRPPKTIATTAKAAAVPRRARARQPERQPTRDASRQPDREVSARAGAVVVQGRNGEMLTRRRTQVGDPFEVPQNEIPAGWSYQWNPVTVTGKEMVAEQVLMQQNGWRPVPANRHPGRWFPPDYQGAIVVQGLRLEERPMALTQEALREDNMRARNQVRDQTDSLRLTQKAMPGAHVAEQRQVAGMRMSIDPALDIPLPAHQPADDSI